MGIWEEKDDKILDNKKNNDEDFKKIVDILGNEMIEYIWEREMIYNEYEYSKFNETSAKDAEGYVKDSRGVD